jgi:hypothetical protein
MIHNASSDRVKRLRFRSVKRSGANRSAQPITKLKSASYAGWVTGACRRSNPTALPKQSRNHCNSKNIGNMQKKIKPYTVLLKQSRNHCD